jgi:hypothetical protein
MFWLLEFLIGHEPTSDEPTSETAPAPSIIHDGVSARALAVK